MDTKQTAAFVAQLRTRLNLSQEQLAARLNTAFATVNRWETGKSKPQRAQRDALLALAEEAGIDPSKTDTPPARHPSPTWGFAKQRTRQ